MIGRGDGTGQASRFFCFGGVPIRVLEGIIVVMFRHQTTPLWILKVFDGLVQHRPPGHCFACASSAATLLVLDTDHPVDCCRCLLATTLQADLQVRVFYSEYEYFIRRGCCASGVDSGVYTTPGWRARLQIHTQARQSGVCVFIFGQFVFCSASASVVVLPMSTSR